MAVTETFANQPQTTVSSGGTTAPSSGSTETWTVASSTPFPAAATGVTQFHVADTAAGLSGEIIAVTNVSGTTWTVTRGAEGTATVAHTAGFEITQVVTAGVLGGFLQATGALLQPYQFDVTSAAYGAKGDAVVVSDGAVSSGSHNLTCSTSTPFTSTAVDGGKTVYVYGAGASGADLITTISSVTSTSVAVLATAASTTISPAGVVFGTDDTTAVKNAVSDAVTYAQNHAQYGEVLFPARRYMIAGAPVTGSPTYGNAQIPLPVISQTGAAKITLAFKGEAADAAAMIHWAQTAPVVTGPVLICPRLDGTQDGTTPFAQGPSAVIGGPYGNAGTVLYGAASSGNTWSNMSVIVDSLQVAVPYNSTYCGFDFYGVGTAAVRNSSCMAMGIIGSGGAWPQLQNSGANITNTWTFGLRMPSSDNNDRCDVTEWTCEGLAHGIMASEHTTVSSMRALQCIVGIGPYCGSNSLGNGMHAMLIHAASTEACGYAVGRLSADNTPVWLTIDYVDIELGGSGIVYDSNNVTYGSIGFRVTGTNFFTTPGITPGYYTAAPVTGGSNLRLSQLHMPAGPVSSPAAAPSSGSAWLNGYYRDAWITLSATTITAVKIDTVTQAIPASATTYSFLLPSGHSYTPTYTGTLTHTVTLT